MPTHRHDAFLVALADHPQQALGPVQPVPARVGQLAHPQPRGITEFQHRPVARVQRRVALDFKQLQHLVRVQRARQLAPGARGLEVGRRVGVHPSVVDQVTKELAQRRQVPLDGVRIQPGAAHAGGESPERGGVEAVQRFDFVPGAPGLQSLEVAPVGGYAGAGQPAAGAAVGEKRIDRRAY